MNVLSMPLKLPQQIADSIPENFALPEWVLEFLEKVQALPKRKKVAVFVIGAVLYQYYKHWRVYGVWRRLGVPGPAPWPLFGNMMMYATAKDLHQLELDLANTYGHRGYYGTYLGSKPSLTLLTPELVNEVMIKQFNVFCNRVSFKSLDIKYFRKDLSRINGEEWRKTRNMLSPTFTGLKLKKMVPLINGVGKSLCSFFDKVAESEDQEFELMKTFRCTTLAAVINVLFGLSVDVEEDSDNEIVKACWSFVRRDQSKTRSALFMLSLFVPLVSRIAKVFYPNFGANLSLGTLIEQMTAEIIRLKKEDPNYVQSDDFLHTVVEQHELYLSTNGAQGMDQESMVAQCLIFLLAGFETTANLMMWTCYYMARHPDLQQEVVQEMQLHVKDKDNISYDELVHLETLDNVLHETLRMNSITRIQREAIADTVIGPGIKIKKGWVVESGVYAMHQNPDIWGDPEVYRPSRWRSEEKEARSQYVFNAFGIGPRQCIGMRLALFEVKMAVTKIVLNYEMRLGESTPTDVSTIEYKKTGFKDPAEPLRLRVSRRS